MSKDILRLPKDIGVSLVRDACVHTCPLRNTPQFVKFCKARGLKIDRKRLLCLERLRVFSPVFRVRTPARNVAPLTFPPDPDNDWFRHRWAWGTTNLGSRHRIPSDNSTEHEAYYSIFQIEYLRIVLDTLTLRVSLDAYLDASSDTKTNWTKNGEKWLEFAEQSASALRNQGFRRAVGFLCQYISDRYYPHARTDLRRIKIPSSSYSDPWVSAFDRSWDWHDFSREWNPEKVAKRFRLTEKSLKHAYETMADNQAYRDPLEKWHALTQFVDVGERDKLKGDALYAVTVREGAHMLRLLHKDLYGSDLANPNEVHSQVITPYPELEVREDARRYLEFVANRYGVNPQPLLVLLVEGESEEIAISAIFNRYFGAHPGKFGIEIVPLRGVNNATGGKSEGYRAILRLIDYLHHHQTFVFLILDNEGKASRIRDAAKKQRSIHKGRRYVTRPEYVKIWRTSFEFENFSSTEIANAMTRLTHSDVRFSRSDVAQSNPHLFPGNSLEKLYKLKTRKGLSKPQLTEELLRQVFDENCARKIQNRPIVQVLIRVARLAVRNPLPTMLESWNSNQESRFMALKK